MGQAWRRGVSPAAWGMASHGDQLLLRGAGRLMGERAFGRGALSRRLPARSGCSLGSRFRLPLCGTDGARVFACEASARPVWLSPHVTRLKPGRGVPDSTGRARAAPGAHQVSGDPGCVCRSLCGSSWAGPPLWPPSWPALAWGAGGAPRGPRGEGGVQDAPRSGFYWSNDQEARGPSRVLWALGGQCSAVGTEPPGATLDLQGSWEAVGRQGLRAGELDPNPPSPPVRPLSSLGLSFLL